MVENYVIQMRSALLPDGLDILYVRT